LPPLSEETANKLINTVLEVHADVKLVKARQEDVNKRLFGNGQPGEIQRLDGEIDELKVWRNRQDGARAESRKWTAVIASVVASVCTSVLEFVFHRLR